MSRGRAALGLLLLASCGKAEDSGAAEGAAPFDPEVFDPEAPGAYAAGRLTWSGEDLARARALTVELWYPAASSVAPSPVTDLLADPGDRAVYQALLDAAPAGCPSEVLEAGLDTPVAEGGPWPVIALSHCYGCARFSTATVAERLASHGFVVVAPDHAGDTLFDQQAEAGLPLDTDTLALRVGDLGFALDLALSGALGVEVDPDRVGLMGHSFGAVTAGKLLQDRQAADSELGAPQAALFVGAPPENPLLAGVDVASLQSPLLFLLLAEDHSVGVLGNTLIASNFAEATAPARLVTMADAGHWSPSDLVGLTPGFLPGCGDDTRQEGGEPFSYLAPAAGKGLTGAVAVAFFAEALRGEAAGAEWLDGGAAAEASPSGTLSVTAR
jgi:dienelactone hydrolase